MRYSFVILISVLFLASCNSFLDPNTPGNLVPKTVDEDPALPNLEINGTNLHLQTFGDPSNQVILFLANADFVSLLRLKDLQDNYFLVFFDQRGYGLSRRHDPDEISLDIYVSDYKELKKRFSPNRKVILIGQTWGGQYATEYISRNPQDVEKAILLGPYPLSGEIFAEKRGELTSVNPTDEWVSDIFYSGDFISSDTHSRLDYTFLIGMAGDKPGFGKSKDDPAPIWRLGVVATRKLNSETDYDSTTDLSKFSSEVLFIVGVLDTITGENFQREQMKFFPSATLVSIDGAGNDAYWVKSNEVLSAIRAYLTK